MELFNYGTKAVDITGWHLADEKGVVHEDVYIHPAAGSQVMQPGAFLLLCGQKNATHGRA